MPAVQRIFRVVGLPAFLWVMGCSAATADTPKTINAADLNWLRRDGFDVDSASLARFQRMGRNGLLDAQLADRISDPLPPSIATLLASYPALSTPPETAVQAFRTEQQRVNAMPEGDERIAAKNALQQHVNAYGDQARRVLMLRAVYGPNQLKEQLVWFWLNHFSVLGAKGQVRLFAADYEERVIRPHALGKFKDLLLATLKSPAMLEYLDNTQNAQGKVNENYARELLELHTLGVNGGYTQQDVQQLALILTGAGLAPLDGHEQKFAPRIEPLVVRDGLFEFNPRRHDFSDKTLLGQSIPGTGFDEISQAVELITRQPACAQFVSRQLAEYFVADNPSKALVDRMASTFQRTDGDIAAVMRTLFESPELLKSAGGKFKDPTQFVVSAVRLAYDGKPIANPQPMVNWVNQLGEPAFGRQTPDGWPLDSGSWASSGQLASRFEIARAIGRGENRLMVGEEGAPAQVGFPMITTRLFYDTLGLHLSAPTHDTLDKATSQQEWNTFLLASPDFNSR